MEPPRAGTPPASGRVLTAANLISFARLLGVPLIVTLTGTGGITDEPAYQDVRRRVT